MGISSRPFYLRQTWNSLGAKIYFLKKSTSVFHNKIKTVITLKNSKTVCNTKEKGIEQTLQYGWNQNQSFAE